MRISINSGGILDGGGKALMTSFNLSSLGSLDGFQSAEIILTSLRTDREAGARFNSEESQSTTGDAAFSQTPRLSIKSHTENMVSSS